MGGHETGHHEMVRRTEDPVERTFRLELGSGSGLDYLLAFDDQRTVGDERLLGERHHRVSYDEIS